MLVVLDPGFFREDGIDSPEPVRRAEASSRLLERLNDANLLLRSGARLVVKVGDLAWFDTIYRQYARTIEGVADRPLKQAFARMKEHHRAGRTLPDVVLHGRMWGLAMMAQLPGSKREWLPELQRVVGAAVVSAAADRLPVVFLCHRILERNVRDQTSENVELTEVLRWRLSVSVRGAPPTVIACVGARRHLDVPWTRRIDARLPDAHGPELHPYCPPTAWMNSQTKVWGIHRSRPCWLDAQGQWWARPSTGGGYHWDVYLNADHSARIGLSQINVTQDAAPPGEGQAGDLHHVPRKKEHAVKDRSGWRCPRVRS